MSLRSISISLSLRRFSIQFVVATFPYINNIFLTSSKLYIKRKNLVVQINFLLPQKREGINLYDISVHFRLELWFSED